MGGPIQILCPPGTGVQKLGPGLYVQLREARPQPNRYPDVLPSWGHGYSNGATTSWPGSRLIRNFVPAGLAAASLGILCPLGGWPKINGNQITY